MQRAIDTICALILVAWLAWCAGCCVDQPDNGMVLGATDYGATELVEWSDQKDPAITYRGLWVQELSDRLSLVAVDRVVMAVETSRLRWME